VTHGPDAAWAAEALAGVAEAAADVAEASAEIVEEKVAESGGDWFQPWVDFNAGIIAGADDIVEERLGVKGTFGFAIIGYTILIKAVTFPLNQSSLRAGAMNQLIQPKMQYIQQRYKNDQETQNRMMMRLWDETGSNPLSGCLPSLLQLPIFVGLYRAITKLAEKNPHAKEPFLWIPSLAGPVEAGNPSLDWLLKSQSDKEFVPLIGWDDAGRYCLLPFLLVVSQFATQKLTAPASNPAQAGPAQAVVGIIPLVIGFTALSSPAGLGIYWFINNIVTVTQTYFIKQQLGKEFPEYQRILDGTDKKEAEERKQRLEDAKAAKEAEVGGLGKGFSAVQAEAEDEAAANEETRPAWREKVDAATQAQAAAARKSFQRRKAKRRRSR